MRDHGHSLHCCVGHCRLGRRRRCWQRRPRNGARASHPRPCLMRAGGILHHCSGGLPAGSIRSLCSTARRCGRRTSPYPASRGVSPSPPQTIRPSCAQGVCNAPLRSEVVRGMDGGRGTQRGHRRSFATLSPQFRGVPITSRSYPRHIPAAYWFRRQLTTGQAWHLPCGAAGPLSGRMRRLSSWSVRVRSSLRRDRTLHGPRARLSVAARRWPRAGRAGR